MFVSFGFALALPFGCVSSFPHISGEVYLSLLFIRRGLVAYWGQLAHLPLWLCRSVMPQALPPNGRLCMASHRGGLQDHQTLLWGVHCGLGPWTGTLLPPQRHKGKRAIGRLPLWQWETGFPVPASFQSCPSISSSRSSESTGSSSLLGLRALASRWGTVQVSSLSPSLDCIWCLALGRDSLLPPWSYSESWVSLDYLVFSKSVSPEHIWGCVFGLLLFIWSHLFSTFWRYLKISGTLATTSF